MGRTVPDKGERILAPPPIENDSFTKEYGIEGGPQNKKSVRNPIMTENLDRHDSSTCTPAPPDAQVPRLRIELGGPDNGRITIHPWKFYILKRIEYGFPSEKQEF